MLSKYREPQQSKYDAKEVGNRCLWGTQLHRVLYVEGPLQREGERERKSGQLLYYVDWLLLALQMDVIKRSKFIVNV